MEKGRKDEKSTMREGLACFVRGLIGKKVLVELRGDDYVYGCLETVDCYLNVRLTGASLQIRGRDAKADSFFVAGRHLRFIHLANHPDVVACVRRGTRNL